MASRALYAAFPAADLRIEVSAGEVKVISLGTGLARHDQRQGEGDQCCEHLPLDAMTRRSSDCQYPGGRSTTG